MGSLGYKEFPYYLIKNLDALKIIIREVAKVKKIFDTGFILAIFKKSKYLEAMREEFGEEDVNKCIVDELQQSYPPYSDSFIIDVIKPPLKDMFFCQPSPKGLELWYYNYLRSSSKDHDAEWSMPHLELEN